MLDRVDRKDASEEMHLEQIQAMQEARKRT